MGEECTGQAVSVGVCTCMLLVACLAVHTVQTSQLGDALRPIHQSINKTIRAGISALITAAAALGGMRPGGGAESPGCQSTRCNPISLLGSHVVACTGPHASMLQLDVWEPRETHPCLAGAAATSATTTMGIAVQSDDPTRQRH